MRAAVSLFFFVLLAGCGYHTPGTADTWVGGDARTLYIQLFDNQTAEPYLENYLTNALVAELSRSRRVTLTENQELADVQLVGEVTSFVSNALAYGATDQITTYRATMKISARLIGKGGNEMLWRNDLQRSEDYPATINKNLQLEGQRLAALQVSQRLAEDVYNSLLSSF